MKMKRMVRFSGNTTFGKSADLKFSSRPDLIIICINRGGGWEPKQCMLPHQFYEADLKELWKEVADSYHGEIAAFPVRADSYETIAIQAHNQTRDSDNA